MKSEEVLEGAKSALKTDIETPPGPVVAIIGGCGQVGAVLTALILDSNKRKIRSGDEILDVLEDQKVTVISIGKKESDLFKHVKHNGIEVKFTGDVTKTCIPRGNVNGDSHYIVTDNYDEINKVDHIILATKAFSYNIELANKIKGLMELQESEPTVTMASNGILAPYMMQLNDERNIPIDILPEDREFVDIISSTRSGHKNLLSCVLNVACQPQMDENKNPIGLGKYQVATPVNFKHIEGKRVDKFKVHIPIGFQFASHGHDVDITALRDIMQNAGVTTKDSHNLEAERLKKLQINMVNALCTLTGKNIGEILDDENLSQVFFCMTDEIAKFQGGRNREQMIERLGGSKHKTSTSVDFEFGRMLEIKNIFDNTYDFFISQGTVIEIIPMVTDVLKRLEIGRDNIIASLNQKDNTGLTQDFNNYCEYLKEQDEEGFIQRDEESLILSFAVHRSRIDIAPDLDRIVRRAASLAEPKTTITPSTTPSTTPSRDHLQKSPEDETGDRLEAVKEDDLSESSSVLEADDLPPPPILSLSPLSPFARRGRSYSSGQSPTKDKEAEGIEMHTIKSSTDQIEKPPTIRRSSTGGSFQPPIPEEERPKTITRPLTARKISDNPTLSK